MFKKLFSFSKREDANLRALPLNDLQDEEIPRYPPFAKGLPAANVDRVIETQAELIERIRNALGMNMTQFNSLVLPVIQQYARFVHLLPASENHHHRGAGGLFRHGLEVSFWATQASEAIIFSIEGTPQERRNNEPRWRLASFLAGLLHDTGKPIADLSVTNKDGNIIWNPYSESLYDWAMKNKVGNYFIRWRDSRRHKRHEQFSLLAIDRILPVPTREYLSEQSPTIIEAMLEAISGTSVNQPLTKIMLKADQESVSRDMKQNRLGADGFNYGVPVERYVFDIIRRLVKTGKWKVNEIGAKVWNTKQGVFITWKNIGEFYDLVDQDKIPAIPRDPDTLADILIERGYAIPNIVNSPNGEEAYYRYWEVAPAMLQERAEVKIFMLRLDAHDLVFTTEPPAPVDAVVTGEVDIDAEIDAAITKDDIEESSDNDDDTDTTKTTIPKGKENPKNGGEGGAALKSDDAIMDVGGIDLLATFGEPGQAEAAAPTTAPINNKTAESTDEDATDFGDLEVTPARQEEPSSKKTKGNTTTKTSQTPPQKEEVKIDLSDMFGSDNVFGLFPEANPSSPREADHKTDAASVSASNDNDGNDDNEAVLASARTASKEQNPLASIGLDLALFPSGDFAADDAAPAKAKAKAKPAGSSAKKAKPAKATAAAQADAPEIKKPAATEVAKPGDSKPGEVTADSGSQGDDKPITQFRRAIRTAAKSKKMLEKMILPIINGDAILGEEICILDDKACILYPEGFERHGNAKRCIDGLAEDDLIVTDIISPKKRILEIDGVQVVILNDRVTKAIKAASMCDTPDERLVEFAKAFTPKNLSPAKVAQPDKATQNISKPRYIRPKDFDLSPPIEAIPAPRTDSLNEIEAFDPKAAERVIKTKPVEGIEITTDPLDAETAIDRLKEMILAREGKWLVSPVLEEDGFLTTSDKALDLIAAENIGISKMTLRALLSSRQRPPRMVISNGKLKIGAKG